MKPELGVPFCYKQGMKPIKKTSIRVGFRFHDTFEMFALLLTFDTLSGHRPDL